jgi:hypothetical protein
MEPESVVAAMIKEKPGSHGTANQERIRTAMFSTIKGSPTCKSIGAQATIVKP